MHEHERFAFLDEETHDRISAQLMTEAEDLGQDDKTSYFFVLPDKNLSVASKTDQTVIKLKDGQIGKGIGHEELPEVQLASPAETQNAVRILGALTGVDPQVSYQFRHNYRLDEVELAVKYTQTWGFHVELECTYEGGTTEVLSDAARIADEKIQKVAGFLGITLASDEELVAFNDEFSRNGIPRGEYSAEEIGTLYGSLFKLAAVKRLPEQQFLDTPTLNWIIANKPEELPQPSEMILGDEEKNLLRTLSLPEHWFSDPNRSRSLHGQLHLARVASLAAHIASTNNKPSQHVQEIFVAGLFHDIARTHDKGDPEHAAASADWFSEHSSEVGEFLGEYMEGLSVSRIANVIRSHDGESENNDEQSTWLANCLRTADALDRYRLPKKSWWIDDKYLEIKTDDQLKALAFQNVAATEKRLLGSDDLTMATAELCGDL